MWSRATGDNLGASISADELVPLGVDDVTTHDEAGREGVRHRPEPTEWGFPQVPLNQVAAKSLFVSEDSFLLGTLLRADSDALEVEPLNAHGAEVADRFPVEQMHRAQDWRLSRSGVTVIGRVLAEGGDHASLNDA